MSHQSISLTEKLTKFNEHWTPKVIAKMNDYQFKLAKIKDEFVWHSHDDTDEMFMVIKGTMIIKLRNGNIQLQAGEIYIVPKGVEHKPYAKEERHIMMIEPRGTVNTGDANSVITADNDVWI